VLALRLCCLLLPSLQLDELVFQCHELVLLSNLFGPLDHVDVLALLCDLMVDHVQGSCLLAFR
jgi:hypothetical protein